MDLIIKSHSFTEVKEEDCYKSVSNLILGDKVCKNCGILVNEENYILIKNKAIGNYSDSLKKIEISCEEQQIKNILE